LKAVALFRGINVGKAKRIAMADLRQCFESLGYGDVKTLLNSGNVIFSAPAGAVAKAAPRIEKAVEAKHGLKSRVTVLTGAEVATIVKENPLGKVADDPSRLLVTVLADPADRARLSPLLGRKWAPDALAAGKRVAYCWCPAGVLESPLSVEIARLFKDAATTRNWGTILKLHALLTDNS
jgi:uncharacterized protein (DUF1697 family)